MRGRSARHTAKCKAVGRPFLCASVFAGAILVGLSAGVRADQIVVKGKNYPATQVRDLEAGQLIFRTASGQSHSSWLVDVDRITVDRDGPFQDFNEAERYRETKEIDRALERYKRSRRMMASYWPELIDARILQSLNTTGRTRETVAAFVKVVRGQSTGPALAARMIPSIIPEMLTKDLNEAILDLTSEIAKTQNPQHKGLMILLKYQLLDKVGDERAQGLVESASRVSIEARARTVGVYDIILHALRTRLAKEQTSAAMAALDIAIKECPEASLAGFLMLKSETLLAQAQTDKDLVRASWPLMRIAIHLPTDPLAGESLLRTGLILERMGVTTKAAALIEEAVASARLSESSRTTAAEALARLQREIEP